jgi:hypothetical protein
MGICFGTIQLKGHPEPPPAITPKHLQQRQVEQNLPSQMDMTPQINSKPSTPTNGFINGFMHGMRTPRISNRFLSKDCTKKIVTNAKIQEALQRRIFETKDRPITFPRFVST